MARLVFKPKEHYHQPQIGGYRPLPFRFMRWHDGTVLLTNEVGEFTFLDHGTFARFVEGTLTGDSPDYSTLKARHLLTDSPSTVAIDFTRNLLTAWATMQQGPVVEASSA